MWDLFIFLIIIMYKERAEGETKQDKLQILLPPNHIYFCSVCFNMAKTTAWFTSKGVFTLYL